MMTFRSRFPDFFRFAALLALWAILVPVGVSLLPMPMAMPDGMHNCGMADHGDNQPDKNSDHKLPSCPICKSMHLLGGGFVPPEFVALVEAPHVAAICVTANYESYLKLIIPPQARPRAPPTLV
jgi:hypothetical protein